MNEKLAKGLAAVLAIAATCWTESWTAETAQSKASPQAKTSSVQVYLVPNFHPAARNDYANTSVDHLDRVRNAAPTDWSELVSERKREALRHDPWNVKGHLRLVGQAAAPHAAKSPVSAPRDDAAWIREKGILLFHDAFDREESGSGPEDVGNGWHSATADRVPEKKQADLDGGVLKVSTAPEAGHAAHIHHDAGFQDGAALVRFKLPGLNPQEQLMVGFVDRECKTVHAGHLCYAFIKNKGPGITLADWKSGVMNLENFNRRRDAVKKTGKVPADLEELLKSKTVTVAWQPDTGWHELLLVIEGDEMRAALDGAPVCRLKSEGIAHPVKRWVSLLVTTTAWVDEVKVWKLK